MRVPKKYNLLTNHEKIIVNCVFSFYMLQFYIDGDELDANLESYKGYQVFADTTDLDDVYIIFGYEPSIDQNSEMIEFMLMWEIYGRMEEDGLKNYNPEVIYNEWRERIRSINE